jgi:leader peptidase (prepilin peptidase) / N-methyltransferase
MRAGGGLHRRARIARSVFGMVCAGASVGSILAAPGPRGLLGAGLALLMGAIALYDARYFIIPNVLSAAALVLALVHAGIAEPEAAVPAIAFALFRGALAAAGFLAIKLGYERLRGRHGLGMGDVKLAGVAGAWLGWLGILIAVETAALAALGAYALRQYVSGRPMRVTGALPFGLYFAPAIWVAWLIESTLLAP